MESIIIVFFVLLFAVMLVLFLGFVALIIDVTELRHRMNIMETFVHMNEDEKRKFNLYAKSLRDQKLKKEIIRYMEKEYMRSYRRNNLITKLYS